MQNKHYFLSSILGIPTFGEGRGQAGWDKRPNFSIKVGNLPQLALACPYVRRPSPPLPESWGTQIKKNDVFFAFWAILSILFFHEKVPFFW